jgi:hypothetical protein
MTLHFLPGISIVASSPQAFAGELAAHLVGGKKDIKSESCPTCLPGKKWSELVHSLLDVHVENGHRAASEGKTTSVALPAAGMGSVRHLG